MSSTTVSTTLTNIVGGEAIPAADGQTLEKRSPVTDEVISLLPRSGATDVDRAIDAACRAQPEWAARTAVERGTVLRRVAALLERDAERVAAVVAAETGKSPKEALG